jgi:hypothetical protein
MSYLSSFIIIDFGGIYQQILAVQVAERTTEGKKERKRERNIQNILFAKYSL